MEKTIIAIDPGTKHWGITIFKGKDIVFLSVKSFSTRGSAKQRTKVAKLVFLSLFDKYVPDILVIEKPFAFWIKQSKFLIKIIEEIKNSARMQRMKVCEYLPETVRKTVCNDDSASKTEMAEIICSTTYYPDLKAFLRPKRIFRKNY